jgi:RNA polymerase sigma-70 factor (ECF subfamily)
MLTASCVNTPISSDELVSNKLKEGLWDESRLVSFLKQGNEEAFRVLIQRYRGRLFSVAYAITLDREESMDIVQDVFLNVYQKIHGFREESRLSTWLYRITVNLCLNWKRRWTRRFRWHHQSIETGEGGDHAELGTEDYDPGTLYRNKQLEQAFWKELKQLPTDARAVFVLKEVEGLSYDEIARALNIKTGTVSSRLFYARQKLREGLRPYLDEEESV